MKPQETVSAFQMSMLFIAFGTGSSIINIPGPLAGAARNGAWISIIIACSLGMLILSAILYMHRRYPDLDFMQYGEKTLGKWLMFLIAIPYLLTIFLMVSFIVIDIGSFFNSTMLKDTNPDVIRALFFFLVAATARSGIEVMVRMFTVFILLAFFFVVIIWCFAASNYQPEFLLPILPDGLKPILHSTYIVYGFPFSETCLFAMLFPHVRSKDKKSLNRSMVIALWINGLMLLISFLCTIMAEGPLAGELKYSLYQLARLISLQDFFERIESVIGFSLIILSYMKATIVLYILIKAIGRWSKIQNEKLLVFPVALICMLLSATMFDNEVDFIESVHVVWPLLNNVTFVLPLLLIVAVTLMKGVTNRNKS